MKHHRRVLPWLCATALLLAGCIDDSADKRIAAAQQHLQNKDTKAAVIEIKNALQKEPESGEARYLLGSILLQEGNVVAAEVELRKAQAVGLAPSRVVPDLARAMLLLGQAKKVTDEFGSLRFDKPAADAMLQTTLVTAYAAQGKREPALAALAAALAADPQYAPAQLLSARQKAGQRDYDGALRIIDDVIARQTDDANAWKLKGDILLYALNKPEDALAAYRKALQANPRLLAAHAAVLAWLTQQGKIDEANSQLAQLKSVAANNPTTKFFEAQLAYLGKDLKRARELTQQLMQVAPNDPRVLQLAGAVELQLGGLVQAEIYLSKALQASPQLGLARRLLIATYLRQGQSAKALTTLNAAVGKDGLDPSLYSLAGEVYLQNGDAKKAEEYFAKALKLDPGDARRRTALALSHLAAGQTESALDELQRISASDAGVTADLALISTHLRRNDFAKALAAIDRLQTKQPDKPFAANLRGRILLAQKDRVGARESFERALNIDSDFFAATASLAAMDVAEKKPEDAKRRFEALIARSPKSTPAMLALAQLASNQNAPTEEIASVLGNAIDASPTDAAPRLLLIDLYLRKNANKQALAAAQTAVVALPSNAELQAALGRVQQLLGESNQAVTTFAKLVNQQPMSPQAHLLLAGAQVSNRDPQAARQSLRKAIELRPDYLDAQRALIVLDLEAKNFADANKTARTIQEQRPALPVGFVLEGDVAVAQKEWDGAAQAYRTALKREATVEFATKLHAVLRAAGKAIDAQRFESSWQKEHPNDAAFVAYLGEQALARNDYIAAEQHYKTVLELQPSNSMAMNNLAWAKGQLKKDGALELAERANILSPRQPAMMDTLAMLLAENGDFKRAIEVQSKALELQPGNASLRLNLAKIYFQAGDKARALAELEALGKLGDRFPAQAEVTTMLRLLR